MPALQVHLRVLVLLTVIILISYRNPPINRLIFYPSQIHLFYHNLPINRRIFFIVTPQSIDNLLYRNPQSFSCVFYCNPPINLLLFSTVTLLPPNSIDTMHSSHVRRLALPRLLAVFIRPIVDGTGAQWVGTQLNCLWSTNYPPYDRLDLHDRSKENRYGSQLCFTSSTSDGWLRELSMTRNIRQLEELFLLLIIIIIIKMKC